MVATVRACLCVLGWVALVGACEKGNATPAVGNSSAPTPAVAPSPPPAPPPSPLETLMAVKTLPAAIEQVRPMMSDTNDEASPGAVALGGWSATHLQWADVAINKNETSFALVRKDSDASRGKRMCLRGEIIQIQKESLGASPVFTGLLMNSYSNIVNFLAVGSTGELVQQSYAKFCGVVIGTYDYSNSAGGQGHAITVVGMFDLPENHPSR